MVTGKRRGSYTSTAKNGRGIVMYRHFIETDKGRARVGPRRYDHIEDGKQYDVIAQEVDNGLSVLLWRPTPRG